MNSAALYFDFEKREVAERFVRDIEELRRANMAI
jgi:hypothetical protein